MNKETTSVFLLTIIASSDTFSSAPCPQGVAAALEEAGYKMMVYNSGKVADTSVFQYDQQEEKHKPRTMWNDLDSQARREFTLLANSYGLEIPMHKSSVEEAILSITNSDLKIVCQGVYADWKSRTR